MPEHDCAALGCHDVTLTRAQRATLRAAIDIARGPELRVWVEKADRLSPAELDDLINRLT